MTPIINRMGFNNDGYDAAAARLAKARLGAGLLGVNVGPNKDSPDRVADYVEGIARFAEFADYFTINISSPNTPGLRGFHARGELERLLDAVLDARARAPVRRPVLVKISPDLDEEELEGVLAMALEKRDRRLDRRQHLVAPSGDARLALRRGSGGLSGRPIFAASTQLLARCFLRLDGALPIIGVGGVEDAATALAKIEAGASLVQIYTGADLSRPVRRRRNPARSERATRRRVRRAAYRRAAPSRSQAGRAARSPAGRSLVGAERMLGGIALGDDFLRRRMTGDGALDRFLGRLVIVFLNLLVVGGFPMDEHADADEQVVGLPGRDRAVGDANRRPPWRRRIAPGRTSAPPAWRP